VLFTLSKYVCWIDCGMRNETYPLEFSENFTSFEFLSIGPKGKILKAIIYEKISRNYYNLAFGDRDPNCNLIDDFSVTNNGDSKKVLVTVALTVLKFLEEYPDAKILIKGSTASRTRLYQICINNNLKEIKEYISISGLTENKWEDFISGRTYDSFMALKKTIS
jgi:hypothetical protein